MPVMSAGVGWDANWQLDVGVGDAGHFELLLATRPDVDLLIYSHLLYDKNMNKIE